jgi:hypothetical protein
MTRVESQPREAVAPVRILADATLTVDLRDGAAGASTDICCPKCGGPLAVDDVDTVVLAAQLRCARCFLTFLQRLRREGDTAERKVRHRWTGTVYGTVTEF